MNVKVVGGCCKKASKYYENVKIAVEELKLDLEVELISDSNIIASMGIITTPALIINDKVVSSGMLLKPKAAKNYIEKHLNS